MTELEIYKLEQANRALLDASCMIHDKVYNVLRQIHGSTHEQAELMEAVVQAMNALSAIQIDTETATQASDDF